jgi:hypothetical protein
MRIITDTDWRGLLRTYGLAAIIFSVAIALHGQTASVIEVSDHRPLAGALGDLQSVTGVAINYEDVPCQNPADLEDVSTSEQRLLNPGYRLFVPRKGHVEATVGRHVYGSMAETLVGVQALLESYRAAGLPGDFKVDQANGMLYVTATRVLNRAGFLQDVQSQMETIVSIPYSERRAIDCMAAITQAIEAKTGERIAVGTFPFLLAQKRVTCGADDDEARDLLATLLSQVSDTPASYNLLFDPLTGYMINVRFIERRPDPSSVEAGAVPSQASSQSSAERWFETDK